MMRLTDAVIRSRQFAGRLKTDRSGAVAIEYGFLAAMLAVALIGMASMSGVTDSTNENMGTLSEAITSSGP